MHWWWKLHIYIYHLYRNVIADNMVQTLNRIFLKIKNKCTWHIRTPSTWYIEQPTCKCLNHGHYLNIFMILCVNMSKSQFNWNVVWHHVNKSILTLFHSYLSEVYNDCVWYRGQSENLAMQIFLVSSSMKLVPDNPKLKVCNSLPWITLYGNMLAIDLSKYTSHY